MFGFSHEMNKGDGISYKHHTVWNVRDRTDKLQNHPTYTHDWQEQVNKYDAMIRNPKARSLTLWERKMHMKYKDKLEAIEDFSRNIPMQQLVTSTSTIYYTIVRYYREHYMTTEFR